MEAAILALRPKQVSTIMREFLPAAYEIMLLKSTSEGAQSMQLPCTTFCFDEEASDVLCGALYDVTGGASGGLKARRAVFVPASLREQDYDSSIKGTLYALPVDPRDRLCQEVIEQEDKAPGFYSLDQVLASLNTSPATFSRQTKKMLLRLQKWLEEKHNVPGAIDLLFSACAEDRLTRSVTNPAFFTETQSKFNSVKVNEGLTRSIANEALAKMMAIEKCDRTIVNPVFGAELRYKAQVDKKVVNKFFGMGKPDYCKIRVPEGSEAATGSKLQRKGSHRFWREEYPLHTAAYQGDVAKLKELLRKDYSMTQFDYDGWCPIHYAAWYGHAHVIDLLVMEGGCDPGLENHKGSTPLHIAASNGRAPVVHLLLQHPHVDRDSVDRNGNTALDLCKNDQRDDWKQCAIHLRHQPPLQSIFLMNGGYREVRLLAGDRTAVNVIHPQMLKILNIPDSCGHLFTIWICSPNLQLQLKDHHRPMEHLHTWKSNIVPGLSNQDPSREEPLLFFRRDATVPLSEERKLRNPEAISLLFDEAYYHYIKNLYPCADGDVLILGGILMQLHQENYDQRRCQRYWDRSDKALQKLVPSSKLKPNNTTRWPQRITAQYKHYSTTIRDRTTQTLHMHFLKICSNLTVYGSAFFVGTVTLRANSKPINVHIGVNDIGIHIINSSTRQMVQSYSYAHVTCMEKRDELEIRQRGSEKLNMTIKSKQAGIMLHLMKRLASRES